MQFTHQDMLLCHKVKLELDRMESLNVISKVEEPTPWCASIVVVPKKNGTIRICVDLKPLNQNMLCEVHPLPAVDDTLAQLAGAKVFSTLEANSGFWQVPLAPSSRLLTTFLTSYGQYCFNKLPFGICSAPEHFQRQMEKTLVGVQCHMNLLATQKTSMMLDLKPLCRNNSWTWNSAQNTAFNNVKAELTKPRVLTHYKVNADLKISADASSYGLGGVLLQKNGQFGSQSRMLHSP